MRPERVARGEVGVLVALVQPRVVVARQTRRSHRADLHAVLQRLELTEQLLAAVNVETLVHSNDLHWNHFGIDAHVQASWVK